MSLPEQAVADVRVVPVRARRAVNIVTTLVVMASVVGSAFSPYLLTHYPLLLLILGPESHHVVLTNALLPGWMIISVTTIRRVIGLIALYGFGWAHGQGALLFIERRFGRVGKWLRWVERGLTRFGVVVVMVAPLPAVCVMAGVAETRFLRAMVAMSIGQLFWVSVTWGFGDLISEFTAPFVDFISDNVLETTLVAVVAVGLWQGSSYLRRRRRRTIEPGNQE